MTRVFEFVCSQMDNPRPIDSLKYLIIKKRFSWHIGCTVG